MRCATGRGRAMCASGFRQRGKNSAEVAPPKHTYRPGMVTTAVVASVAEEALVALDAAEWEAETPRPAAAGSDERRRKRFAVEGDTEAPAMVAVLGQPMGQQRKPLLLRRFAAV